GEPQDHGAKTGNAPRQRIRRTRRTILSAHATRPGDCQVLQARQDFVEPGPGRLRAPIKGADPQLIWLSTLARSDGYPIRTALAYSQLPIRTSAFARMNDTPLQTRLQLFPLIHLIRLTD